MPHTRTVFFVSDGTGITAETLGNSLLAQFEGLEFRHRRIPFVDSADKAQRCMQQIRAASLADGIRPIVFTSLVNPAVNRVLRRADALFLDLFEKFIEPMEQELGIDSIHAVGRFHTSTHREDYMHRIEAINFTLAHDDGVSHADLEHADIILVGVSRSGKTPTSIYLAMQFGVKSANYPLIPEDFERGELPGELTRHRGKLFGLTITPERLHQIRNERRPDSRYASLSNCRYEVDQAERLMKREDIPFIESTTKSIEEIATTIMHETRIGAVHD
jgi:regulator of PEP synthase PpsR (kinase-PPPase family)